MIRSTLIYGLYVSIHRDVKVIFTDIFLEMFAEIEGGTTAGGNVLTTNFDTYTLILQLVSCIPHASLQS